MLRDCVRRAHRQRPRSSIGVVSTIARPVRLAACQPPAVGRPYRSAAPWLADPPTRSPPRSDSPPRRTASSGPASLAGTTDRNLHGVGLTARDDHAPSRDRVSVSWGNAEAKPTDKAADWLESGARPSIAFTPREAAMASPSADRLRCANESTRRAHHCPTMRPRFEGSRQGTWKRTTAADYRRAIDSGQVPGRGVAARHLRA